jgi:hypothetical protein
MIESQEQLDKRIETFLDRKIQKFPEISSVLRAIYKI